MEKKPHTPCNCPNQYLVAPKGNCEICSSPVLAGEPTASEDTAFDADYFEQLEVYLDSQK